MVVSPRAAAVGLKHPSHSSQAFQHPRIDVPAMVSSHVNDQATFSQVRIKLTGKVIHGMRFRSFLDHVFEIDVTDGVVRVVANLRFSSVQSVRFLKLEHVRRREERRRLCRA